MYVPADVDRTTPEQQIVEAAAILPEGAALTGWAALRWWGAVWFDGRGPDGEPLPVPLSIGIRNIRPQDGLLLSKEAIRPRSQIVDGLPLTPPARSAAFEMRYAHDLADAVVAADMALHSDLVSSGELWAHIAGLRSWTGVPQAREALLHADENSWSPTESRTRMIWTLEAGLPTLLCNRPVFSLEGRLIGIPDLLDADAGLAIEYDGALHLAGEQRREDIRRHEAFAEVDIRILTVLRGDLARPRLLASRFQRARASRWPRRQPARWTLEQPSWWRPDHTVRLRRQHRREGTRPSTGEAG